MVQMIGSKKATTGLKEITGRMLDKPCRDSGLLEQIAPGDIKKRRSSLALLFAAPEHCVRQQDGFVTQRVKIGHCDLRRQCKTNGVFSFLRKKTQEIGTGSGIRGATNERP